MIRIGKKKSPFVKKQFVPMAAFGNDLVPLVHCCHGVGEGDLELLHEAEVTGFHIYIYICRYFSCDVEHLCT